MNIENYGGNKVKQFQLGNAGKEILGLGPYEYFIYETVENEEVLFDRLNSFTVFLFDKQDHTTVRVAESNEELNKGDLVQVEGQSVKIMSKGGVVKFLVAGTFDSHPDIKGVSVIRHKDIYKVIKPWGHELWLNGNHPCYALKQIFIKAGTKTSLQYHNFKQETNVLFEGTALLHYKLNPDVKNDLVISNDITTVQIEPISSVDILPSTLHRLEAISDITLYETSTPHLNDVVRVSDDSNRPDGRIEKEHLS